MIKSNNSMIDTIFGVPIYISEKFNLDKKIVKFLKDQDFESNNLGNSISESRSILDLKECVELKEFIQRQVNYYFHDVCQIVDDLEIYITESWLNMNKQGQDHVMHIHPNSVVSGVYYFSEETDCPIIYARSYDNHLFGSAFSFTNKEPNRYNSETDFFSNLLHKTIISPSRIQHLVPENTSRKIRYSLAYNTFVRGKLGQTRNANVLYLDSVK